LYIELRDNDYAVLKRFHIDGSRLIIATEIETLIYTYDDREDAIRHFKVLKQIVASHSFIDERELRETLDGEGYFSDYNRVKLKS
jgi:hypothetical protein